MWLTTLKHTHQLTAHFLVREWALWTVHIHGLPCFPGPRERDPPGRWVSLLPRPLTPDPHAHLPLSELVHSGKTHVVLIQTEGNKKYGGNDWHGNSNLSKDLPTMNTLYFILKVLNNCPWEEKSSASTRERCSHLMRLRQKPRVPHPSRSFSLSLGRAGGQPAALTRPAGLRCWPAPHLGTSIPTAPPVLREEPWARADQHRLNISGY